MKFIGKIAFFGAFVILAVALSGCLGNINGTLEINAFDSAGKAIPKLEVKVTNALSGESTNVTTDDSGKASLELAPGEYTVSAKYLKETASKKAKILPNGKATVNLEFKGKTPINAEVKANFGEEFELSKDQTAIVKMSSGKLPIYVFLEEVSGSFVKVKAGEMNSELRSLTIQVNDYNVVQAISGYYALMSRTSDTEGKAKLKLDALPSISCSISSPTTQNPAKLQATSTATNVNYSIKAVNSYISFYSMRVVDDTNSQKVLCSTADTPIRPGAPFVSVKEGTFACDWSSIQQSARYGDYNIIVDANNLISARQTTTTCTQSKAIIVEPAIVGSFKPFPDVCDTAPIGTDSAGKSLDKGWLQIKGDSSKIRLVLAIDDCNASRGSGNVNTACLQGMNYAGSFHVGDSSLCSTKAPVAYDYNQQALTSGWLTVCSSKTGSVLDNQLLMALNDCNPTQAKEQAVAGLAKKGSLHVSGISGKECSGSRGKTVGGYTIESGWLELYSRLSSTSVEIASEECPSST